MFVIITFKARQGGNFLSTFDEQWVEIDNEEDLRMANDILII